MADFVCSSCGSPFSIPEATLDRFPGWTPRTCLACRDKQSGRAGQASAGPKKARRKRPSTKPEDILTVAEVLEKYTEGPTTGVFTDGSAHPNPGQGGWGAVYVVDDEIVKQIYGDDRETTNNRMELTALLAGAELVPKGTPAIVYTDSNLVARTVTEWAAGWEKRGWKRKTGPVENLDLVQAAYYTYRRRPELTIEWVPAHSGYRWNEYADALSTAYRRDEL